MAKYIIFVHGLGGVIDKTWGRFPDFLIGDSSIEYKVLQYGYTSPNIITQFLKPAPTILNIANGLLTDMKHKCDLENDDIILVGHSMGGLVIKRLLLRLKAKQINHNIKKICFFDVPHDGAGLANVGKYIAPLNRHLKSLCCNSPELDDMNDQWVDNGLDNIYDILSVIDANETVVSSMSSKSIFRHHEVETINNVNHSSIVKPTSESDTVVVILKSFINSARTINKFTNRASVSYKNWIRHDRRHSLEYVADAKRQSAFQSLCDSLSSIKPLVRLTGLSGLGKSRLLMEYIKSNQIPEERILIYDALKGDDEVFESLSDAIASEAEGFAVIENCEVQLHDRIEKLFDTSNSKVKVVTVNFYHEEVKSSVHVKLDRLQCEQISILIKSILPSIQQSELDRIESFVEGFPLLAEMISTQIMKEGNLSAGFTERDLVEKLINGDKSLSDDGRELLRIFSLFDYFPFESAAHSNAREVIDFMVSMSETSQKFFGETITKFTEKEIINCTGHFARLVPKPLALNLAIEWWELNIYDRQEELISNLPSSILESFCKQLKYLDSSVKVESFVEKFLEEKSPFGQAELLTSKKGSRLFRALVEVNPKATSEALYRVFKNLSDDEIIKITEDARRNFVWALEMLVFHQSCFEKSAWCLFKLAQNENESYSNNATGQFSQIFRWQLSGAGASFQQRLELLNNLIDIDSMSARLVCVEALKVAIDLHGGSRTIGAEYQGTKETLKEWRPETWAEVFSYCESCIGLLLELAQQEDSVKYSALNVLGHSIRSFVINKQYDLMDKSIKYVVKNHGSYWPAAVISISNIIDFDFNGMEPQYQDLINTWLQLLSPPEDSIEEQLKSIIINPPWRHRERDGKYCDISGEMALELAIKFSTRTAELIPYLSLLLKGEQRKTYLFGQSLSVNNPNIYEFIDTVISLIIEIEKPNLSLLAGLLNGLYEKNSDSWNSLLGRFSSEPRLIPLFPDVIRTGKYTPAQLTVFLKLIQDGVLEAHSASVLSYGSVTDHLSNDDIKKFCVPLSTINSDAAWSALDVIFMYCFAEKEKFQENRKELIQILLLVNLDKNKDKSPADMYHWQEVINMLLPEADESFSVGICKQIISASKIGFNHSDLWSYIKPTLLKMMKAKGDILWPLFAEAIVKAEGMERYWLQQVLDRENSFSNKMPSIISVLPVETVLKWCKENSELAPTFVANSLNVFETDNNGNQTVSKMFVSFLEGFGNLAGVWSAISSNIHSRGWSGSIIPILETDKAAVEPLLRHHSTNVKNWAKDFISNTEREIEFESKREDEAEFGRGS